MEVDEEPEPDVVGTSSGTSAASASVFLTGDRATVRLLGGPTILSVPGPIPPGTYTIEATFEGESPGPAGTIELAAGQRVTLSCRSSLKRCIAR